MKKLVLLGLAMISLLFSPWAESAWNAAWPKRAKITLDSSASGLNLPSEVAGVPLLVRLHTGNFAFSDAKPDGSDLRFVAADDTTPLKYHIEKFDGLNELALVWVQLPRLAASSKADFIWVYYGNAAAAAGDDARGTYDPSQALVFHFGEREALPQDSTANANHALRSTAKPSAAGLIGGALAFDGQAELVVADKPSLAGTTAGTTVSFWVKPAEPADATLFMQGEGANALRLNLRGGKLVAQLGALNATASSPLAAGVWQHVALTIKDGVALYLGGVEVARVAGTSAAFSGALSIGRGFKGELDELQVSSVARVPEWIRVAAQSQGPDQKLLSYGAAEGDGASGEGGDSVLRILLSAVTLDGWIVIGVLVVMFVISVFVMISKAAFVSAAARDNERFMAQFEALMNGLKPGSPAPADDKPAQFKYSSLYRLYAAGAQELRNRFAVYAKEGREMLLSDQSINAIRATVDARFVRETQVLNSRMVLLTISIAGGPFLGLLGTVVGVMITFAAIAAAGDVNVNAIAPGIAAALVATVAGLAVAIPALFGYNYLTSRIQALSSDMQAFVDEFITRVAENHSV